MSVYKAADLRHVTPRGDLVRSKSEVIVACVLDSLKLPYVYEQPLHHGGQVVCLPDFTIRHKDTEFYWEHLGMLSDPNYKAGWEKKQSLYRQLNLTPRLITSRDDPSGGIDACLLTVLARREILQENVAAPSEYRRPDGTMVSSASTAEMLPVPFSGFVRVKLTKVAPFQLKDHKIPALEVSGLIEDADALNLPLSGTVICGGRDKSGEELGHEFVAFLISSGTGLEFIARAVQKHGTEDFHIKAAPQLVGRSAFAEIETVETSERKLQTRILAWVTKRHYDTACVIGAHRRRPRGLSLPVVTSSLPPGTGPALPML